MTKKLKFAQIGMGQWGPNLFRNFWEQKEVDFQVVVDLDASRLEKIKHYEIPTSQDCEAIFQENNGIDAVVISTPVISHFTLVKKALLAGKHVFVEKPLTNSLEEAEKLVKLSEERNRILMVGHVFLFHSGIRYVKNMIERGELGTIYTIHGQRTNLGPIRQDVSALWDLVSHDVSIFNYWLNEEPLSVSACGSRILHNHLEDVVNCNFYYSRNISCQILASWLHPKKVRQITVVGSKKMVIWDDMTPTEPIRIYDKTVQQREPPDQVHGTFAEFIFLIQEGDLLIPRIQSEEPLKKECRHFVECIQKNIRPMSDGATGAAVVRALQAAEESIQKRGAMVFLASIKKAKEDSLG